MNAVQQRWAHDYGLTAEQFRKLARLVNHAARMQTREHNEDNAEVREACNTACNAVDEYAAEIGMSKVDWNPGIYPLFSKNGHNSTIPID
jgi:hypothetical protein